MFQLQGRRLLERRGPKNCFSEYCKIPTENGRQTIYIDAYKM